MECNEQIAQTILHSFAEQLSLEKKNIAKRLIAKKMPLETIAEVTGLSLDEVKTMEQMIE